jgi:hypothetical protein
MRQFPPMTRRKRRAVLAALLLGLTHCSGWLPPYETMPAPAHGSQSADAHRIAVCYNFFTTTPEQVRALAAQSCGADGTPRPVERDFGLVHCPVLLPARATFACIAP